MFFHAKSFQIKIRGGSTGSEGGPESILAYYIFLIQTRSPVNRVLMELPILLEAPLAAR